MAVNSFKPTLWEGALIVNFHNVSIAEVISTKPSSVQGEKVKFNRLGSGTLKDYSGTVAWDEITTTPIDMIFDQRKYFAFSLDDVDAVQLKADVMNSVTAEHAAVLAETYDTHVLTKLAAGAKAPNIVGSASAQKPITAANVYDHIVDLATLLSKKKCPKSERYVIVNAEILGLLSKDARFTANPVVLSNGVVEGQSINGMQLIASEELPNNKLIAIHKSALGCAKQLQELEAMRLQTSFSDGVRGLCVYGSVVLREESIALLHYSLA